jgi:hypothetical protein
MPEKQIPRNKTVQISALILIGSALLLTACSRKNSIKVTPAVDRSLVLALAVLGENDDGTPKTLPGRVGILTRQDGKWNHRILEDTDNNVFHKAMAYGSEGLLTLGGTKAVVKLWRPDGTRELLWEADFGGQFSRMRDAEIGNIYGDGKLAIAIATHDQGVVAVLRREASGRFKVEELIANRTPWCMRSSWATDGDG